MKNYCILYLLLIVTVISCRRTTNEIETKKMINEFKGYFVHEPFEFFDSLIYQQKNNSVVNYPVSIYANGYCGMFFKKTLTEDKFNSTVLQLENNSIFKSSVQDTIKYFVPQFRENNNYRKFPVPNVKNSLFFFFDKELNMNTCRILGLRYKKGNYFTQECINQVEKFKKENISHLIGKGYSNGATIDYDSKTIIYWIIIW